MDVADFFRARYAYAQYIWRFVCFFVCMFQVGFYFSVDFNGILVDWFTNHQVFATQQVRGVRFFELLLVVGTVGCCWHVFPAPARRNETTLWLVMQCIAYGYKFGWAAFVFFQWFGIMRTSILHVTHDSYPYGDYNCLVSRMDNVTYRAVVGFAPGDWNGFGVAFGAQLFNGFILLVLYLAVYQLRRWLGEVAVPEDTKEDVLIMREGMRFLFSTNSQMDAFQYVYSLAAGLWLALSVIPGWALWWTNGNNGYAVVPGNAACGAILPMVDLVAFIIYVAIMVVVRLAADWAFAQFHCAETMVDPQFRWRAKYSQEFFNWTVQVVRNSFGFVFATVWGSWVTFSFSPLLVWLWFGVAVDWVYYPVVTGAGNTTAGVIFGVSLFFSLFFVLAWAYFERMFPSTSGDYSMNPQVQPSDVAAYANILAMVKKNDDIFKEHKTRLEEHLRTVQDAIVLEREDFHGSDVERKNFSDWERLFSSAKILAGPTPSRANVSPRYPEDLSSGCTPRDDDENALGSAGDEWEATQRGVMREGFDLTLVFSLAFLWAWWFSARFMNYLIAPVFAAANIDGAAYAPHQFIVNIAVTAIFVVLWLVFEAIWEPVTGLIIAALPARDTYRAFAQPLLRRAPTRRVPREVVPEPQALGAAKPTLKRFQPPSFRSKTNPTGEAVDY